MSFFPEKSVLPRLSRIVQIASTSPFFLSSLTKSYLYHLEYLMISFRRTLCEPEGDDMQQRGQTTSFQVRLEMMEQASAGLNDPQIAPGLGCSLWTVRKWRRRALKRGRVG